MYITDELIRGIQKMMFQKKGILVTKIQRFSLHDGPGIRTTVFLKDALYIVLGVVILKICQVYNSII